MVVTTMLLGLTGRQGPLRTAPPPALSGFGPPLLAVPAGEGRAAASWYTGFGWLLEPAHEQRQGAMRIEPTRTQPTQTPSARQPAEQPERPAAGRSDSVELSDGAEYLRRAREEAAAAPDVRAERVAAIKDQIQAGTYQIDDTALAEKLLDVL
jgi:negative regulator of flagellin synthesis FlgM